MQDHAPSTAEQRRSCWVRMSDGTRLATDVYLPRLPRHGRAPVVLARVPYGRREMVACLPAIGRGLVDRGFALVAQDIRGRYDSEGLAVPFADTEQSDGYDTLEWIAAQSWSERCVVALGDSYGGWLAYAAAVTGHPLVRGVVAGMTSTRVESDWLFNDGAFSLSPMLDWATVAWSSRENRFHDIDWTLRPLADLVRSCLGVGSAFQAFAGWAGLESAGSSPSNGALTAVRADRVTVPTLHLGGWWDIFRAGQVADWQAASRSHPGHFLTMVAADHHQLPLRKSPWLGSPVDDDDRFADRYLTRIWPFLDATARGRTYVAPAVDFEVARAGRRTAGSWPPPGTRRMVLSLVDGGRARSSANGGGLSVRPARATAEVSWEHDPAGLVPALEPDPFALLLKPVDQRAVQARDDVLTFTTAPFDRSLTLVGCSLLHLATPSPEGRQWFGKLTDVHLDGRSFHITSGVTTIGQGRVDDAVIVRMAPCAYRVAAGHSIRVEMAASHFPRFLPAAVDPWHDLGGVVPYTVIVGGSGGSFLELATQPE